MPGPVTREQINSRLDEARYLTNQVPRLEAVLDELDASRRLNRRAIDTITTAPGLRSGLHALEHTALALRALYRLLADVQTNPPGTGVLNDSDVRAAFGTLLHDVAKAIRDFGALVRAEADDEGQPHPEELAAALDSAGEARARLTELLLVDPRTDPEQWQLTGALLDRYRSGVAGTRSGRARAPAGGPARVAHRRGDGPGGRLPGPAAAGHPVRHSDCHRCRGRRGGRGAASARRPLGSWPRPGLIGTIRSCQLSPRCAANVLANFLGRSCE